MRLERSASTQSALRLIVRLSRTPRLRHKLNAELATDQGYMFSLSRQSHLHVGSRFDLYPISAKMLQSSAGCLLGKTSSGKDIGLEEWVTEFPVRIIFITDFDEIW